MSGTGARHRRIQIPCIGLADSDTDSGASDAQYVPGHDTAEQATGGDRRRLEDCSEHALCAADASVEKEATSLPVASSPIGGAAAPATWRRGRSLVVVPTLKVLSSEDSDSDSASSPRKSLEAVASVHSVQISHEEAKERGEKTGTCPLCGARMPMHVLQQHVEDELERCSPLGALAEPCRNKTYGRARQQPEHTLRAEVCEGSRAGIGQRSDRGAAFDDQNNRPIDVDLAGRRKNAWRQLPTNRPPGIGGGSKVVQLKWSNMWAGRESLTGTTGVGNKSVSGANLSVCAPDVTHSGMAGGRSDGTSHWLATLAREEETQDLEERGGGGRSTTAGGGLSEWWLQRLSSAPHKKEKPLRHRPPASDATGHRREASTSAGAKSRDKRQHTDAAGGGKRRKPLQLMARDRSRPLVYCDCDIRPYIYVRV